MAHRITQTAPAVHGLSTGKTIRVSQILLVFGTIVRNQAQTAHVQKSNGDMSWYIIPLCKYHNGQHGATFEMFNNYEKLMVKVTDRGKCC